MYQSNFSSNGSVDWDPSRSRKFSSVDISSWLSSLHSFYSQLIQYLSCHGFIVVVPQVVSDISSNFYDNGTCNILLLYKERSNMGQISKQARNKRADATKEIKSTPEITNWLTNGLQHYLPPEVEPNLKKLGLAGHSRGGKVAFALALGRLASISIDLKFSALIAARRPAVDSSLMGIEPMTKPEVAGKEVEIVPLSYPTTLWDSSEPSRHYVGPPLLIGVDPVDGMDKGKQTPPSVLTYIPHSFNSLDMPVMVLGSGLGEVKKNPLFPACACHIPIFHRIRPR
ncbi:putative EPIDERMAL PATTERNING FACTOR-like protein 4-like [Capsicum annuum]|nr:putative EPIDERMAL PATTERNING FACTOR-like protein 4-like [Capsicum annuum]